MQKIRLILQDTCAEVQFCSFPHLTAKSVGEASCNLSQGYDASNFDYLIVKRNSFCF